MKIRKYSELKRLKTFEDRFDYLNLAGVPFARTFGSHRHLNQALYTSDRWKKVRNLIIVRDDGCDLGVEGHDINDRIIIHHMNPITIDDVLEERDCVFDPENLVCTSRASHKAIHYGDLSLIPRLPIERKPGDTKLW